MRRQLLTYVGQATPRPCHISTAIAVTPTVRPWADASRAFVVVATTGTG